MSEDVVIKVKNLSKNFHYSSRRANTLKSVFTGMFQKDTKGNDKDIQHALKNISFEVKKGEFFGIVGRNGSGKSTLLKILAGIYQPTKGSVSVSGKLVPFIELGVGFNPELTGKENVYLNGAMLGFSKQQVDKFYGEVVEFAELEKFMNKKLKNYSSGMQVRLAFSMAIRAKADILLIDEVLAVGDADFQRKCFEYFKSLKRDNATVIFISHDMATVREFCDRTMLLNDNKIQAIGNTIDVSGAYNRLFLEEKNNHHNNASISKRWGDGSIKIIKSKTKIANGNIVVSVRAKVNKPLSNVMYGLHIISQDGKEVMAMNNRMIGKPDLTNLIPGVSVSFTWEILDVFSSGQFSITLTLVDSAGIAFDWYTEAVTFIIKKIERSTTPILPPVKVKYEVED